MWRSHFLKRVLVPGGSGIAAALGLPMLIASCRPSANKSAQSVESATQTGQAESAQSVSANKTDARRETALWRVAIASNTRPFALEQNNQLVGFDVELIKAIATACGATLAIESQPFAALIPAVQAQQIDVAIGAIPITNEGRSGFDFSVPYFDSGIAITTHANSKKLSSLKALQNKAIAVVLNTVGASLAIDIDGARILTYNSSEQALKAVETDAADAALVAFHTLRNLLKTKKISQVQQSGALLKKQSFGIAIRQIEAAERTNKAATKEVAEQANGESASSSSEINRLEAINSAIQQLKRDGTYDTIYQRWLGED